MNLDQIGELLTQFRAMLAAESLVPNDWPPALLFLPCEPLALDHHRNENLVRFSVLHLDADTERISGELNPHLSAPWLQLASEFTLADLEARLMLRWANYWRPCGTDRCFDGHPHELSLTVNAPVSAMKTTTPNVPESTYLSNLFVCSPPAYSLVEARLFARALGGLLQKSQRLSFQLAFHDIIPGGNADGQQYAQLRVAVMRLMQAINDKSLRQEKGCCLYMQLFSILSLDADAEQIMGKFNHDLKAHLLDLGIKFSTAELELLLMRR